MLKLTKTGIGLLTRQYRSVLHKCWLINVGLFGLIATATITSPTSADEIDKIYIDSGTIDTVEGSFSNRTTVTGNYGQGIEMWGGQINYINVDAKNNNFTASFTLEGGYLLQERGEIGTITGNYINNTVRSTESFASSAALFSSAKLNSIANAIFKNNQVISSTFGYGGALLFYSDYNTNRTADIGKITADFDSNKVIASGNELAYGGAISLLNAPQMTSTIDEISGIFSNNGVETNSGSAWGGAISNNTYQDAASQTTNIIHNIYDSTFTSNYAKSESGSASGGAIYNTGTIGISAKNTDTVFRDNKTIVGSSTSYNDIYNSGTLHLNAASGKTIDFGGSITGTGTLNINNGYEGAATGGKYIFRSALNADTLNIGGGAYINFNSLTQANNTHTSSYNYSTNTVVGGAGSIVDAYNGTLTGLNFGNLTLNQDLTVRLEANLWNGDSGSANNIDHLYANSYNGSGSLVIDEIWLHDEKPDTPVTNTFTLTDSVLKDHIMLASSGVRVLGLYKNNAYDITYDSSTGKISLIPNGGGTYNLVGFLTKDTSSTNYSMNYDEYISYMDSHSMVGTNKTINAGNYTIYGGNNKGFIVGANKSLTINGGVWDGFSDSDGGVLGTEVDSTLEITNAIFRNNITTGYDIDGVVLLLGGTTTKLYADFINNHGIPTAGEHASAWGGVIKNSGTINSLKGNYISNYILASGTDDQYDAEGGAIANFSLIKEIINSSFTDNSAIHTASEHAAKGGAIANRSVIETIIDSSFADNYVQAPSYMGLGGAIYNAFQIGKFDTDGTPIANTGIINAIFEGNNADKGGAIYNDTGGYLIISDSNFNKNIAQTKGGAIYNGGTMYIYATTADVLFSENYTPLSNVNAAGILNAGDLTLDAQNGKKIIFEGNYGEGDTDGIAISNSSGANLSILGNVIFRNNYNVGEGNGGQLVGVALLNQGHIYSIGSVNNQALFENNHSSSENTRKAEGILANQGLAVIDNMYAEFKDNYLMSTDQALGGAIYNDSTITNIQNSTFSGNYVSGNDDSKGGAIYNEGSIGFSGTNTFTNNKANEVPNDIYNAGTININGGTTTLNSGYIGSETSALTVKSGGTLTANAALEVADGGTLTNESGGTLAISADNLKIDETTNNGTLELEGGNVTTKLMGTGRMKLMSGNVRLLSSTPPATTGSLSFGSSSDYADSILTSSSAASTSDHALVTAGYLDNNYYMNYRDSMTKSFTKAANDNHKNVIVMSAFKPSSYGKRSATIGSRPNQFAEILVSSTRMTRKESTRMTRKESIKMTGNATTTKQAA